MILDSTKAYKDGEKACLSGRPLNSNPHLHKKDVISCLKRSAWERGFKNKESDVRGA